MLISLRLYDFQINHNLNFPFFSLIVQVKSIYLATANDFQLSYLDFSNILRFYVAFAKYLPTSRIVHSQTSRLRKLGLHLYLGRRHTEFTLEVQHFQWVVFIMNFALCQKKKKTFQFGWALNSDLWQCRWTFVFTLKIFYFQFWTLGLVDLYIT